MMKNEKVFTKIARLSGNYCSSYVFENDEERQQWLVKYGQPLADTHGDTKIALGDLDGLKIGEKCHVVGEGSDVFVIEDLIEYNNNRYGFVLNSGWVEEVAKCYRVL